MHIIQECGGNSRIKQITLYYFLLLFLVFGCKEKGIEPRGQFVIDTFMDPGVKSDWLSFLWRKKVELILLNTAISARTSSWKTGFKSLPLLSECNLRKSFASVLPVLWDDCRYPPSGCQPVSIVGYDLRPGIAGLWHPPGWGWTNNSRNRQVDKIPEMIFSYVSEIKIGIGQTSY